MQKYFVGKKKYCNFAADFKTAGSERLVKSLFCDMIVETSMNWL